MYIEKRAAFTFAPAEMDFSEVHRSGFNTVIFGYDKLEENLIRRAKDSGFDVWIEIGCFVGEELWEKYPNSRPVVNGTPVNKLGPKDYKWYAGVVPTPEIVADRLQLIEKLMEKHKGVDVYYLDFCRFPGRWEDGEEHAVFADNTINDQRKRSEIITGFVANVKNIANTFSTSLGIFLTPYDNEDFGQDLFRLQNICDYFSPMLYHNICGKPVGWIGERAGHYQRQVGNIVPVIQSLPEPDRLSSEEFAASIQQVIRSDPAGIMVLTYEAMDINMRTRFRETA